MSGDPVDVLMSDYLAEITLAALSTRYKQDTSRGYLEYFLDQIRPHLPAGRRTRHQRRHQRLWVQPGGLGRGDACPRHRVRS